MVAHFEHAVETGNFGVGQSEVRAFAADDDAGFVHLKHLPLADSFRDGQEEIDVVWELKPVVDGGETQAGGGGVGPGEGRHGGDDYGFVHALLELHDSGFAAVGAAELNFGVFG